MCKAQKFALPFQNDTKTLNLTINLKTSNLINCLYLQFEFTYLS